MDSHCHLSTAHYLLLLLLVSSCMQSTTKLCFCLAGDEISSSGKTNSCIDEERQALRVFKQHLVDHSGRLSSWVGHDCCRWEGISCNNSTGHVVKMDLRNPSDNFHDEEWKNASLGGNINASLLSLKHLNYLDLSQNLFVRNQIPMFFGELKSLQYLNLSSASFGGEIPSSLGNLSSLNFLDLGSNYDLSSKNLNWLSHLSSLKYINLSGVNLNSTGVSWAYDIIMLPSLLELHLSSCQIESIPLSLQSINLTSLLVLDMSDNGIKSSSFPSWFFNLTNLVTLDLSGNDFRDPFPSEFSNFKFLENLDLSETGLKGQIPKVIGNLCKLKVLSLSGNKFDGGVEEVMRSFSNCPNNTLASLDLSHNQFRGNFPSYLKCPNLTLVDLSHNQLEGPLPLWCFPNVSSLYLESNFFSGQIPSNIDQMMPKLQELILHENHLNGTIPPSICNIQKLQLLSLRSNQFSGELPHAWRMGTHMAFLDVGQNNLSGKIPISLGVLSFLKILKLNDNNFDGEIPDSLQNCSRLRSIDLGDNKLSGNIPLWIGRSNVSMLSRLRLRSNYFTGLISQELCNLPDLVILDLSHNNLSGTIPMCLDNLTSLVNDDSYECYYDGFEQARLTLKGKELVYSTTLYLVKSIDLSSNNLQGEIPEEISSLIKLGTLNLSMNQLSGKIPSKIGNLRWLETLDLSHNHLSGQIPQSLASLTSLSHLDLSYNNLSGRIPSGNQLQTLNVSSIYMGNPWLCGVSLSTKCPEDDTSTTKDAKDKNEEGNDKLWFYVSVVLGFIIGFWGVCGTLILKTSWRYAYFQFFDDIKDKVALAIALKVTRFKRFLF